MKNSRVPRPTLPNLLVAFVLAAVPFHAFLTVWCSTLLGHYTLLRLWDEVVLLILLGIAVTWLIREKELRSWFFNSLLIRLICSYVSLTLLLGAVFYIKGDVSLKALWYGVLVNLRFLVWFLVVLLAAQRSPWLKGRWVRLLIIPAVIVVGFATLQYTVLPHQFLEHFGYGNSTIAPIETINHNSHYIRVQSTLRGANPLGAYLIVILAALATLLARKRRQLLASVAGLVTVFALYASGSRSAWIGAMLAIGTVVWFTLPPGRARRLLSIASVACVLLAAGAFLVLRNNISFQNAVLHTQNHSSVHVSSNAAHASAVSEGMHDVLHQPFGDGPGTAGPASEYNSKSQPRIAENYYLQVAQETGWLGLVLFVAISYLVGLELYHKAARSPLALAVFAAYIGVLFVNVLSHAWTDDTLAYIWWGFAGVALAEPLKHEESS